MSCLKDFPHVGGEQAPKAATSACHPDSRGNTESCKVKWSNYEGGAINYEGGAITTL